MKIGMFTDIHIHTHSDFAGPDGRQRLRDGLEVLSSCLDLLSGCDVLIFLGDLFHVRKSVDVEVLNEIMTTLSMHGDILSKIKYKYAITGNHDWTDVECRHSSLEFLSHYDFVVVKDPLITTIDDNCLVMVPWMQGEKLPCFLDKLGSPTKPRTLYIHATPSGSESATGFKFSGKLDLKSYAHKFARIFCGDIHKRQFLRPNLHVLGAPMHHNFGDEGQDRGIHIYDTDDDTVEFISLAGIYPEFVTYHNTVPTRDELSESKCYHRIIVSGSDGLDKLKDLSRDDRLNVKVVAMKTMFSPNRRLRIDLMSSKHSVIERYAGKFSMGIMDLDKLIDLGKDLLP